MKMIFVMLKTVKRYRSAKTKRAKAVKRNIAAHPFVIAAVIAATAIVIFIIMFNWFRVTQ